MHEKLSITTYNSTEKAADTKYLEIKITAVKLPCRQTNMHAEIFCRNTQKMSIADMEVVEQMLTIFWLGSRKVEEPRA